MHGNEHAVYVVTICVPLKMHKTMLEDPFMGKSDIVKSGWLKGKWVHLQGKIGESTRFYQRKRHYSYAKSNTGRVIDTLTSIILNSCFIYRRYSGCFDVFERQRFSI